MAPTTLVLRSLVRDVGKKLPRDGPIFFKGGLALSTSRNLHSMHVPGFTLRDNHRTDVLSKLLPPFLCLDRLIRLRPG